MINRRILNATPTIACDGTQMKSKSEVSIYNKLKDLGYNPQYEQMTFTYWKGIKPKVPFYDKGRGGHCVLNNKKLIDMKYTPDITFMHNDTLVIMEVKGWQNDQYPIREKLFRSYIETLDRPIIYAKIFTVKQLLEFLRILNE